ncbi:dentin sialophosphoprotein [Heracleum sosnowskyi]|uniref:Dentin sialophosphoprotein n=1 Tax=Heracleum sosnowskyi TaxID=360622 RepID=A0AAD8MHA6_9APIA|nr:dentin sialophosphoprotein [Heracleum sosnowskyi]
MFGTAGKSGRGGRGGAGKKRKLDSKFRSASIIRTSGGRPAGDVSRNKRTTTATPVVAATAPADETYSLVTGNPLDFAMIIRLTPDLVDEIKRAESQGGSARIKFDAIANNSSGNVIDVGGKDFRFTWSREMGDLCDIYEERHSGEDGDGLLVESGCAWRKLNVQRVLDESTKNHVKMRSEEAERKSKSRKVTILENGNPPMKSQMKALAASEATPRKMPFKQKQEPPCKKRKAEPPPGPPKSAHKHVLSCTSSKGRTSSPLLPSAHDQPHASASPFGTVSLSRSYASVEDNLPIQTTSKEKPSSSKKGMPDRVITNAVVDKVASKGNSGVKPTDLRSMLIFLLTENPRGMSLKALEKSVGQNFPDAGRQIKPIIKKIATYQPPGRYILKSGAELESLQKSVYQIGSSPENNQQQTSGPGDKCDDIRDPVNNVSVKTHTQNDEPANLNSVPGEVLADAEEINIPLQSPDHYAEKKVSDNNEGLVATPSKSGSDSDSSDCESDSGSDSRSRSKSPVGSRSGSSSDSESDGVSNSKEGSDEEVDIMTSDDDKGPKDNLQASEPELSTSPILCRPDGLLVQNVTDEKEDLHASQIIEIKENSHNYAQVAEFDAYNGSVFNDKKGEQHPQAIEPSKDDCAVSQGTKVYRGDLHRERDIFRHEESDKYQRKPEGKSKKRSYEKHFDDNDVRSKKVKAGSMMRAPMQIEDGYSNEKRPPRNPRDSADQNLTPTHSHHRKPSELPGNIKEVVSNSNVVNPSKDSNISEIDSSPFINGRSLNLRREPSELELGELRDPLPEETTGIKKQSDNKGSIEQSEGKLTSFDNCDLDIRRGGPAGRTGVDPIKPSSADLKNRGTFFDNNKFSYCKYEKDKPELRGPIKDHSRYIECVKEYQEKYDSYLSIYKILESERNEFLKFGRDLEAAKEKDMIKYYSILEELKESYRQCGTRHKRLKKVYLVLYRELKTLKEVIKDYANHCPNA